MTDASGPLAIVACGAPLASRTAEVARCFQDAGWTVRVVATRDAMAWVPDVEVNDVTGFPTLVEQRQPGGIKRFPPPAHVVVCPATFNTVNKLAAGIADTYAHSFLSEALATGTPITVAPMISTKLWGHPVLPHSLDTLATAGVRYVDVRSGRVGPAEPVESGSGDQVVEAFDPGWLVAAVGGPAQMS